MAEYTATIRCPHCGHSYVLSDRDTHVIVGACLRYGNTRVECDYCYMAHPAKECLQFERKPDANQEGEPSETRAKACTAAFWAAALNGTTA